MFGVVGRVLGRLVPPGTSEFVNKAAKVIYKGLTPDQRTELDVQLRELELKEKQAMLEAEVTAMQILDQSDTRQSKLNNKNPGPRNALMWILAGGIGLTLFVDLSLSIGSYFNGPDHTMELTEALLRIPGINYMVLGLFGIAAAAKTFERTKNGGTKH